ncbi:MAG: SUMF1/EgtB/PvdO family nonheme iron enzyme [Planctomycetota bacterium]|nr:SUMF1/EgtB/PvdO family nonheme iron enzyme [Planctomycetota bacterium]
MSPTMLNLPRIHAIHLLPVLALTFAVPAMPQEAGPPGMVFVKGGRYKIGTEKDNFVELYEEHQVAAIVTETPQYEARLDDFYIMPTEVTNEQFARFVRATDSRPPQSWGKKALDDATIEYTTAMGKLREEAKQAGEPLPKIEPFDRANWWKNNWMEATWAIPKGTESEPVVFIDYEQAEGYARWAGLRLMSEEEFQAAGRGDTKRYFPWGDTFDQTLVNSLEARRGGPVAVGKYEAGCAWVDAKGNVVDERNERNADEVVGIYDLTGNVWEWTRTPFTGYPKFESIKVKDPIDK